MTVCSGRMPHAAVKNSDENVTIGIQPYAWVSYPNDVMYENVPKINRDNPVPNADPDSSGFRPILSTKLKYNSNENVNKSWRQKPPIREMICRLGRRCAR